MAVDVSTYVPDFDIKINGSPFRSGSDGSPMRHGTLSAIRDARIDVLSVSVTETTGQSDNFTLTVRSRLPELQRFPSGQELLWIDDDQFKEGNQVNIEMGYVGNRSFAFAGEITDLAVSFAENGLLTLTVTGQSLYGRLHRGREIGPVAPMTDSEIVKKIAGLCKLKAKVDDTTIKRDTFGYKGMSFHNILQDRARRIGYEVYVKGETLFFQKPRYKVDTNAKIALTWGKNLISFSSNRKANSIPTHVSRRGTVSGLGGDKEAVGATVGPGNIKPYLADQNIVKEVQSRFGQSHRLAQDFRVTNQQDAQSMATADLENAALEYNTGEGSAIGNPQLIAREIVEVTNIGGRLSGKYYVASSTHTIDASGYRTRFTLKRDG